MDIDNFSIDQVLWSKVLRQAKEDLTHNGKQQDTDHIRRNARAWIERKLPRKFSNEICDIPGVEPQCGSFLWVCGVLDLNPDKVRESVLCEQ